MRTTADILAALGGREAVAALTGTRLRTVEQWNRNGVPHKHFDLLVEAAKARGIRWLSYRTLYEAKAASRSRYGGSHVKQAAE